jgi:hypothetical protein
MVMEGRREQCQRIDAILANANEMQGTDALDCLSYQPLFSVIVFASKDLHIHELLFFHLRVDDTRPDDPTRSMQL